MVGRNRDQQAAAGLRIAEHQLVEVGDASPIDLVAIRLVVAPASIRKEVPLREVAYPFEERHGLEVDVSTARDVGEMPDQSISGDVRSRSRSPGQHRHPSSAGDWSSDVCSADHVATDDVRSIFQLEGVQVLAQDSKTARL